MANAKLVLKTVIHLMVSTVHVTLDILAMVTVHVWHALQERTKEPQAIVPARSVRPT